MNRILAYSAIKIRANPAAPYSTLNPDTSSDSPSAKSKGVRLVSARHEISHTPARGVKINNLTQNKFWRATSANLIDFDILIKKRMIIARLTS